MVGPGRQASVGWSFCSLLTLLSSCCSGMHDRCSSCGEGRASRGRSKKLLWMIISAELTHRGIIGQAASGALGKESQLVTLGCRPLVGHHNRGSHKDLLSGFL